MITTRPFTFKNAREDGFTFVELLVVMATVAILALLLLPALAGTKPNSQAFQCLENERQLILGWQMYAADNTDLLPPNDYPYTTAYAAQSTATQAKLKNWVVGTMEQPLDAGDAPASSGHSELLDPNTLLSPYLTNTAVYRCPADDYIDPPTRKVHVRSYSMNSAVGTIWNTYYNNGSPQLGSPLQGGWLPGNAYNASQTTWLTYGKISSFSRPGPANTFVIMDENPYSINDGALEASAVATPGNTYLIDSPAGNHNGAAGISFADGHVIIHKWQDSRTYTSQGQQSGGSILTHQSPDNPDCFYLAPITSAPR
jgi:prepilin-type N-terminal cleavage/methylation domain-containing protein/prepilin-type processing-associated H-X9-DG protein